MPARPLLTTAAGALLLVSLTGCQKPTPGVTMSAGTHSVHVESTTFCRDGQTPQKGNCVTHLDRVGKISLKAGEQVSIDVASGLADHGWIIVDADAQQRSNVQKNHHFSFTPSFQNSGVVHLEVRSLDHAEDDAQVTGIWKFELRLK